MFVWNFGNRNLSVEVDQLKKGQREGIKTTNTTFQTWERFTASTWDHVSYIWASRRSFLLFGENGNISILHAADPQTLIVHQTDSVEGNRLLVCAWLAGREGLGQRSFSLHNNCVNAFEGVWDTQQNKWAAEQLAANPSADCSHSFSPSTDWTGVWTHCCVTTQPQHLLWWRQMKQRQ